MDCSEFKNCYKFYNLFCFDMPHNFFFLMLSFQRTGSQEEGRGREENGKRERKGTSVSGVIYL